MDLIAGRNCKYRGRTIPQGSTFSAPRQFARVLIATGRAKAAPPRTSIARPARAYPTRAVRQTAASVMTAAQGDGAAAAESVAMTLGEARGAYRAKFGKGPSPRWDVATILEKIAAG